MNAGGYPAAAPRIREDVVIGPALVRGGTRIHVIKDPVSGRKMTVGAREYFIISRLDGEHGLDDITAEYAAEFGRRLDDRAWGEIMATLAGRSLLDGCSPPELAGPAPDRGQTLLRARFPLVRPGPWLARTGRWTHWAFSPVFVSFAMAAAALACVVVALNPVPLFETASGVRQDPWIAILAFVVLWGVVALHELGHGLAAIRFGARVGELGIGWRFPLIAPYCAVEEIQLLPARDRVRIAFAGVFVSLLSLPMFLVFWLLAPEGTGAHTFASVLLLFGTFAALLNFVPFFRLDGYAMLNHALGTEDLARDSLRHVRGALSPRTGGAARVQQPPRPILIAYVAYAVSGALFYTVIAFLFAAWWFSLLEHLLNPWAAAGILVATAFAITAAYRVGVLRARARDATRHQPTGKEGT